MTILGLALVVVVNSSEGFSNSSEGFSNSTEKIHAWSPAGKDKSYGVEVNCPNLSYKLYTDSPQVVLPDNAKIKIRGSGETQEVVKAAWQESEIRKMGIKLIQPTDSSRFPGEIFPEQLIIWFQR